MSRIRLTWWAVASLLSLVVAGPAGAANKLGVFPPRLAPGVSSPVSTPAALDCVAQKLVAALQEANVGEVVLLAWPDGLAAEGRPTFETLVGRGAEVGCNGVVALQAKAFAFGVKDQKLPFVGTVTSANALVTLEGGLIDVASAAAVAPLAASAKDSAKGYKGPDAGEVAADPEALAKSPLGRAITTACAPLVTAVRGGLARLAPAAAPPRRAGAPEGVGFAVAEQTLTFPVGWDRRGLVSVVNRGNEAQSFVVRCAPQVQGVAVGLMGQGSPDGPFTLEPGQWKYVRLVANSPSAVKDTPVPLSLTVGEAGKAPAADAEVHDTLRLTLHWQDTPHGTKLAVLGQDPATLAWQCQLTNPTDRPYTHLHLSPQEGSEGLVRIEPPFQHAILPPGGKLEFEVVPLFPRGVRRLDVKVEGDLGLDEDTWPYSFEIPEGKRLLYGVGHTVFCGGIGEDGTCTNYILVPPGNHNKPPRPPKPPTRPADSNPGNGSHRPRWHKTGPGQWEVSALPSAGPRLADAPLRLASTESWDTAPRGGVVRPAVAARLPRLAQDLSCYPLAVRGGALTSVVYHAPAIGDDGTAGPDPVLYATTQYGKQDPVAPQVLSEAGHCARWPNQTVRAADTRAFVVWEDAAPGAKHDVAFRSYDAGENAWSATQRLTTHGLGVNDPVVCTQGPARVMVAWEDLRDGSGQIRTRFSRDSGATFGAELALPREPGEYQAWPQLAALPDGWALAYVSRRAGSSRVLVRYLAIDGTPAEAALVALSSAGAPAGEPRLAVDPNGPVYVVWREGEGAASEIWLATAPKPHEAFEPARQLTHDAAYSEYPSVEVTPAGPTIAYHSDRNGRADLVYRLTSPDGGKTWGEPEIDPSRQQQIVRAYVEAKFSLEWPRSHYQPHNTRFYVNDVEVGALERTVPEGVYVFDVPPELIRGNAFDISENQVRLGTEMLNASHYLMVRQVRLLVEYGFSQLPVVAASQAEADTLAAKGAPWLNHGRPDLSITANGMTPPPAHPKAGSTIQLACPVFNLGDVPATGVKAAVYTADPSNTLADLSKSKLAEVPLGELKPGEGELATLSFKFDPRKTQRVHLAVAGKETDWYGRNNTWPITLTGGEETDQPTPLLGTDIPDLFGAPSLLSVVNVADVSALQDFVNLPQFGDLARINGWPVPTSAHDLANWVDSEVVGRLNLPSVPGLPRVPGLGDIVP